jgi:secreted trypsin-like serine protease
MNFSGDSGGGFIVKTNGKWYLRGIVSSSLINPDTYECDTSNFVVFTDVTKFTDWILQFVGNYG